MHRCSIKCGVNKSILSPTEFQTTVRHQHVSNQVLFRSDLKQDMSSKFADIDVKNIPYSHQSLLMFCNIAIYIFHYSLIIWLIEVRLRDVGPTALIKKLPWILDVYVVTTKIYLRSNWRVTLMRNCLALLLSSLDAIKFRVG